MGLLDATIGGPEANSFATVAEADSYFCTSLDSARWDNLATTTRARALISATRDISGFNFWGVPAVANQALPFPRVYPGESDGSAIPTSIKQATFEHALLLAEGGGRSSKRARLRAEGVTSFRLGDASESFAPLLEAHSTEGALSQFSGRVQRLLSQWIRTAWQLDSGRRPIGRGRSWPTELGG